MDNWTDSVKSLQGASVKVRKDYNHPLIPKKEPHYQWPEVTQLVATAIEEGERVYLAGPASTGKSSLIRQIGAFKRQPVTRVNFNRDVSVEDFLGHHEIENGKMSFHYGVLPMAMKEGHILLLDEIDAIQPAVAFILQSVLEPEGLLFIPPTGETVLPHKDFGICATANTKGYGDASGLYSLGTHSANHSQLDRWGLIIDMDYLPAKTERKLLEALYPEVETSDLQIIERAIKDLRVSFKNKSLMAPITLRSLQALCRMRVRRITWSQALIYTVLNKSPEEDHRVIREVFQRHGAVMD